MPGSDVALALANHPELSPPDGMMVLRPDTLALFANASWIRDSVIEQVTNADRPIEVVVLDFEASYDLDVTSLETLASLKRDLAIEHVDLWLSNLRTPVRAGLERARAAGLAEPDQIFDTVGMAVAAYTARTAQSISTAE